MLIASRCREGSIVSFFFFLFEKHILNDFTDLSFCFIEIMFSLS